jgi:hypothetical protein
MQRTLSEFIALIERTPSTQMRQVLMATINRRVGDSN